VAEARASPFPVIALINAVCAAANAVLSSPTSKYVNSVGELTPPKRFVTSASPAFVIPILISPFIYICRLVYFFT